MYVSEPADLPPGFDPSPPFFFAPAFMIEKNLYKIADIFHNNTKYV